MQRVYRQKLLNKALFSGPVISYDHFNVTDGMYDYIKDRASLVFSNRITSDGFNIQKDFQSGVLTNVINRPDSISDKWNDRETFTG